MVGQSFDKGRVRPDRRGACELHAKLVTQSPRFYIQVKQDFQMIRDKADGLDDHRTHAIVGQ